MIDKNYVTVCNNRGTHQCDICNGDCDSTTDLTIHKNSNSTVTQITMCRYCSIQLADRMAVARSRPESCYLIVEGR